MDPIIDDDEEFIATARIYHRYRLAGFHRPGGNSNLSAIYTQPPIPIPLPYTFDSPDEERIIDQLISPIDDERDQLRQDRLRTIAIQEATSFESTLSRREYTRYYGFQEYIARHESVAKLTVRLFRADIPHPKQVQQFHVYRIEDPTQSDVFLFGAQGPLVEAFLRRIATGNPHLTITHPRLDLKALSEEGTTQIRGASFRITGKPNLTTAMVFGPDVNEDDSWETYSRIGQLTYVHLQVEVESQAVRMMVTGRGSILPYGVDDIHKELTLCKDVYENLLRRFEVGNVELRKSRRRA